MTSTSSHHRVQTLGVIAGHVTVSVVMSGSLCGLGFNLIKTNPALHGALSQTMQCREHSGNFLSGPVKTDDIRCLLLLRNSIRVAKVLLSRVEIEILSKFCAIRSQLSFVRMMELCQGSKDHENLTSTQLSTDIWWQRLKSCCKWNEENCQLTTFTNCHNCTFLSLSRPIHSVTAICNFRSQQLPINGMTIDNVECRENQFVIGSAAINEINN